MNSTTITVPTWSLQALAAGLSIVIAGLLTGFIVEYVKHRYTLAQQKDLAKFAVHNVIVAVSAVMTAISYYLPFLQQNLKVLEKTPYIGAYAVSVYAAANYLYALKGKTWFQNILSTATKLDAKLNAPVLDAPAPAADPQVPADSLEVPGK